ncbi:MAG: hypothetical protein NTZ59_05420 [Bacteroidetes bacterium]|jgi:hypothetical protein|nr:hypothetical protein [Bacteroidota bacterium]
MQKIKYLFLIVVSILMLSFTPRCNSVGIKRVWLFSKQQFAGIVRLDEDGKKSKGHWHNHAIILELKEGNVITWDSIVYQNKTYEISSSIIKQPTFNAGKISDDRSVVVAAKKNRYLVQVQIQNLDVPFENNVEYEFTLYGTKNNEKVNYNFTSKNVNLMPDMYQ